MADIEMPLEIVDRLANLRARLVWTGRYILVGAQHRTAPQEEQLAFFGSTAIDYQA